MGQEANRKCVERWGEEVATNQKYDVLDELLAPSFVDHDPASEQGPGIEGLKDFFRSMHKSFPDLKGEGKELVATDDYVTMRYTLSGTHKGEWKGAAPTGKTFEVAAVQLAKFDDQGRCTERWGSTDELGLAQQLGVLDQIDKA